MHYIQKCKCCQTFHFYAIGCPSWNTFVLDEKNPHIRTLRDGTVIKLDESNGVYTIDMWICLDATGPVFSWQGQRVVKPLSTCLQGRQHGAEVTTKIKKSRMEWRNRVEWSWRRTWWDFRQRRKWDWRRRGVSIARLASESRTQKQTDSKGERGAWSDARAVTAWWVKVVPIVMSQSRRVKISPEGLSSPRITSSWQWNQPRMFKHFQKNR